MTKKPLFGAPLRESVLGLAPTAGAAAASTSAPRHPTPWPGARTSRRNPAAASTTGTLQRQLAAPALDWRYGADGELLLQAELLRDRRTPDRGSPASAPGRRRYPSASYGDPLGDHLDTDAAQLKADGQQGLGRTGACAAPLAWFDVDSDFSNTSATRPSADGLRVERGNTTPPRSRAVAAANSSCWARSAAARCASSCCSASLGWQDKTTQRHTGSAPTLDLFDPDLSQRPSYSGVLAADSDFSGRVLGLYVQDQIDLGAQWKALAGLRWDRLHQRQDDLLRPTLAPLQRTDTAREPAPGPS